MRNKKILKMVQLAVLIAIIVLMAFTPLGFFKTAGVEITFIMIPVVIGAVLLGPAAGAILGGVFGIASFIQCFGMSVFGAALLGINPFFTLIVCIVPRILMGWLCGLLFNVVHRFDKSNSKLVSFGVASLGGPLLNTIFFMASIGIFFYNTDFIQGIATTLGTTNIMGFMIAFVGINGMIEAAVCFIVSTAVTKALSKFIKREPKISAGA